jgi:HEAT repeat protein
MAKRISIDERMDALAKLRAAPLTSEGVELLKSSLAGKLNLAAAKAATIARDLNVQPLIPDLAAAFHRFIADTSTDKACLALTSIVEALQTMGANEPDVYLRGIRHVQMEPAWGGPSDVAAKLRCESAFGLVRIGYRNVIWELAGLLADADKQCRIAAVKAIGHSAAEAGMPLLKYKIRSADGDTDVAAECFASLVQIDAAKSISFLAAYLDSPDAQLSEAAALALASTRRPKAFELLRDQWNRRIDEPSREILALAIATHRSEPALEFLISQISTAPASAATVLKALAPFRRDDALRARIAKEVSTTGDAAVTNAFEDEFGRDG